MYGAVAGTVVVPILSVLVGLVAVTTGLSLIQSYQRTGSVTGALGGAVGFFGAGCASCGAGILSLLGVADGAAILPFEGLGVQVASIGLMLLALEYNGRSEACSIQG